MFQNLKNKIKTETGQDPIDSIPIRVANNRTRHSLSSHNSLSIDELSKIEEVKENFIRRKIAKEKYFLQKEAEISSLKNELVQARSTIKTLEDEKKFLEESIEAGQVQREIFVDETDKIQNVQHQEIMKLKSMLLFREQVL
jgi:golgin subfamily A member 1